MHGLSLSMPNDDLRQRVRCVIVWATGGHTRTTTAQPCTCLSDAMAQVTPQGFDETVKREVRQMLKFGKYRASGRGKPASEFLLGAAQSQNLTGINNWVDVNNAVSLETGLPSSIFDAAQLGREILFRHGQEGESYIFNPAGHEIQLRDLPVVCRRGNGQWEPCGNPVKDAMGTKTTADTCAVVAVVYAPAHWATDALARVGTRFCKLLEEHCAIKECGYLWCPGIQA